LVLVRTTEERELRMTELAVSLSPAGFDWGSTTSGAAALAHSLLVDMLGDITEANEHYEALATDIITTLPRGDEHAPATELWVLEEEELRRWWWVQHHLLLALAPLGDPSSDQEATGDVLVAPYSSPLVIYPWSAFAERLIRDGFTVHDTSWTRGGARQRMAASDRELAEAARCGRCGSPCVYVPARRAHSYRAFMVCRGCNAADEF
jgi:hypothetical protein